MNTRQQQDADSVRCAAQRPQQQYWLSSHVYACQTSDGAVLLDVRRNSYIGLSEQVTQALTAAVVGWQSIARRPADASMIGHCINKQDPVRQLVANGVLTTDSGRGHRLDPIELAPPASLLSVDQQARNRRRVGLADILNFVTALATAQWLLRVRSFEHLVSTIKARKARYGEERGFDIHTIAELIWVFRCIRPFFFTSYGNCLLHALTLTNFLAKYDLFPTWVVGVKTGPFAAHSWVQSGRFVLDCAPDQMTQFTPILAI